MILKIFDRIAYPSSKAPAMDPKDFFSIWNSLYFELYGIDNQQIKTTDCSQLSETFWIVVTQLRPALNDLSAFSS